MVIQRGLEFSFVNSDDLTRDDLRFFIMHVKDLSYWSEDELVILVLRLYEFDFLTPPRKRDRRSKTFSKSAFAIFKRMANAGVDKDLVIRELIEYGWWGLIQNERFRRKFKKLGYETRKEKILEKYPYLENDCV